MNVTDLLGSGGGGGKSTSAAATSGVWYETPGAVTDKTALYIVGGLAALALIVAALLFSRRTK